MPKQFFETLTKDRLLPKEILALRKLLISEVGKPCSVYTPGCPSCQIWLAYIELESHLEKWEPKKPKKQWKPKKGEMFYYVYVFGNSEVRVEEYRREGNVDDVEQLSFGNVYPTKKLAEEAAKRILRAYKI
jgi:hypothetical protein